MAGPDRRPALLQVLPRLEPDEPGRGTVDLARFLRAEGWRSFVASGGGRLERELTAAGATHLPLPLGQDGRLAVWQNGRRLGRLIRQHGINLVHARAPAPIGSAAAAARHHAVPFVVTWHALPPAKPARPLDRRHLDAMTGADRVIAVSEFMAEQIAARFAVEPARLRTVRPGLDAREFDPERVRGHRVLALAERWGIAPGERVVMVLPGSGSQDRGHLLLLQAVARMAWNDFLVLFVGGLEPGTPQVEELLAMLRRTGLGAQVRFGGDTDDLPAALALADLVVLPATEPEPSGLAAAAAQAMGKPVIVTSSGALSESVLPAATGWLVPADDPDELARALELGLAMDEEARARLAARARTFVLETFAMEAMCARTLAVYRELLRPAELPIALQGGRAPAAAKSPA